MDTPKGPNFKVVRLAAPEGHKDNKLKAFAEFRKNGEMVDMSVIVRNETFRCHQVMLFLTVIHWA